MATKTRRGAGRIAQAPAIRRETRQSPATRRATTAAAVAPRIDWLTPATILELGWLLAAIVVPLYYDFALSDAFELPKQVAFRIILEGALFIAGLVALARRITAGRSTGEPPAAWLLRAVRWPPLWVAAVVMLAWSVCTALSVSPNDSFWGIEPRWSGWRTQAGYVAFFLVGAGALTRRTQVVRLAIAVAAAGSISSLVALYQRFITPDELKRLSGNLLRPHGTLGNANFLADYLAISLVLTAGGALRERSSGRRVAWIAAGVIQAVALELTETRGAWIGAAAGLVVFGLLFVRLRRGAWGRWLLGAAAGMAALVALAWAGQGALHQAGIITRGDNIFSPTQGTAGTRLALWRATTTLWQSRPLTGYGPDTFETVLPRFLPPKLNLGADSASEVYDRAHSATFDALEAVGLLGYLALVFAGGVIAGQGRRLIARPPGEDSTTVSPAWFVEDTLLGDALAVALPAALVAHVVAEQFSIESAAPSSLAWLLAGAIVGCARRGLAGISLGSPASRRDGAAPLAGKPGWLVPAAAGAGLVLACVAGWWEWQPRTANAWFHRGQGAAQANRASEASFEYTQAVGAWPHEYRYWLELGYARLGEARTAQDVAARPLAEAALAAVERSLALDPENPFLWASLGDVAGQAAAKTGDKTLAERARAAHQRATEIAPQRWRFWSMAATTSLRLAGMTAPDPKDLPAAKAQLERALALYDGDWVTWSRLGDALAASGDRAGARQAYARSLQLNPESAQVRQALTALS